MPEHSSQGESTRVVLGRSISEWVTQYPLINDLVALRETAWFNPAVASAAEALTDVGLTAADIDDAEARLARFAPYLAHMFPELEGSGGVIESPLRPAPNMQRALSAHYGAELPGRLLVKCDSHLPVSGSIKARGGIHEVLQYAERLALEAGVLTPGGDYRALASDQARTWFGRYGIAVGSTGNLGLSIGIMGATLGLRTTVHMSADARAWKKNLLRTLGVTVREYEGDFTAAVAAGRAEAKADPATHFVDDESSISLFLGYAVAARRLHTQLQANGVAVDAEHPLFVYLPCGVGGGPGGVSFGLRTVFGDDVHPVFAEPTHSPCMLLGVYTGQHDAVSVQDFGIDNRTDADGLAVGRPSRFVGQAVQRLVDGYLTVTDGHLFALLARLHENERLSVEPSAAAGFPGPWRVLADTAYRERAGLTDARLARATHVVWATGGAMVPPDEQAAYLARGRRLLER